MTELFENINPDVKAYEKNGVDISSGAKRSR